MTDYITSPGLAPPHLVNDVLVAMQLRAEDYALVHGRWVMQVIELGAKGVLTPSEVDAIVGAQMDIADKAAGTRRARDVYVGSGRDLDRAATVASLTLSAAMLLDPEEISQVGVQNMKAGELAAAAYVLNRLTRDPFRTTMQGIHARQVFNMGGIP